MPKFNSQDYKIAELPDDTPLVCEIAEAEDTEGKSYDDPEKMIQQLQVRFEVAEGEFQGQRFRTWINAESFHPRSNMRKLCYAAMGYEDLRVDLQVDTDELVGKRLLVIGDHGEDGQGNFRPRKYKVAKSTKPSGGNGRTAKAEPKVEAKTAAEVAAAKNGDNDDLDF
jgi:hypothetical protein